MFKRTVKRLVQYLLAGGLISVASLSLLSSQPVRAEPNDLLITAAQTGTELPTRMQGQPDPTVLRERVVFPKPTNTVIGDGMRTDVFVLKWHEGTRIRLRNGQFVFDPSTLTPADHQLLQRFDLTEEMIKGDLSQANALFQQGALREAVLMFSRPEADLEKEKTEGEQNSGEELADLNLYTYLFPMQPDEQTTAALIDSLNALSTVEIAYPQPDLMPAPSDIPPTTPSYVARQGYLDAAPNGIDARYAWRFPGGKGGRCTNY